MNNQRAFDAAQARYDAMTPPEDGPSECECGGSGLVTDTNGEGGEIACETCNGTGYINEDGSPYDPEQAAWEADEYADMRRGE